MGANRGPSLLFTGCQLTQRRKYSKKEPTGWTQWREKWSWWVTAVSEMKSSLVPAVGSQSSEVPVGCSLEMSTHFSACKCCFLSCLRSWLGNSAHHRGWPSCLCWKSTGITLQPSTNHSLHRQVLEQVTPEMGPIPSCSLSLTWPYPTLLQY